MTKAPYWWSIAAKWILFTMMLITSCWLTTFSPSAKAAGIILIPDQASFKLVKQDTAVSKPVTLYTLQEMKRSGEKFVCITAYDALFAGMFCKAGVEVLLIGDSLGMVLQGHDST